MTRTINILKRGEIVALIKKMKAKGAVNLRLAARQIKASVNTVKAVCAAMTKGENPATARRRDMDKARKAPTASRVKRAARRSVVKKLALQTKTEAGRRTPCHPTTSTIKKALPAAHAVSRATVYRDLCASRLKAYVRPITPFDEKKNAKFRLKFANQKLLAKAATDRVWKSLVFVDESFLDSNDRTSKTQFVPEGEQHKLAARMVKNRFNVPHLMIFAAIGYNYKSELVFVDSKKDDEGKVERLNAERYQRMCLSKIMPQLKKPGHYLVQDGARCHIAKTVMLHLDGKGVAVLPNWPAYSPDLNPIENVWKLLSDEVAKRSAAVQTVAELKQVAIAAWAAIPTEKINNYVMSFRGRLRKVRESRGARVVSSVKLGRKTQRKKGKKAAR